MLEVTSGNINFINETSEPVTIKKRSSFADVVRLQEVNSYMETGIGKIVEHSDDKSHFERPKILQEAKSYLDQIVVDPDNQFSNDWKLKFRSLCSQFSDTKSPFPGRYNGFYGDIDNSIDFVSTPPPSVKARLPHYSADKMKIMGQLMDDLELMGVLAKPEAVGVTPAFVVPSLLTPKPEKGEWRLVSDFTPLNIHIRKFQNVSSTI